jgi:AcrR family transcriptional regulator
MRRREKSSQTRQHILDASMHLFSRLGYPNTTVREIAREAGITDAAIYYHFRTKEDVLHALVNIELVSEIGADDMRQLASLHQVIRSITESAVCVVDLNRDLLRIILREALAGDPAAICRYHQLVDGWESRIAARLRPFEGRGTLECGTSNHLGRQIVYTIVMAVEDYLLLRRRKSRSSPAERREDLRAFLRSASARLVPPVGRRSVPSTHRPTVREGPTDGERTGHSAHAGTSAKDPTP